MGGHNPWFCTAGTPNFELFGVFISNLKGGGQNSWFRTAGTPNFELFGVLFLNWGGPKFWKIGKSAKLIAPPPSVSKPTSSKGGGRWVLHVLIPLRGRNVVRNIGVFVKHEMAGYWQIKRRFTVKAKNDAFPSKTIKIEKNCQNRNIFKNVLL